ncbi:hypothetical protein CAOG_03940 [Capsaspora owczarzaki ATCC 30864]|uniref:t-SNARE coiled-coil homology domain-containing protein n=1 Tax=Capsaspora owczarzaki (strain ATCC 30864) TaxID=595528 RepID=A0A0D2WP91_CAPO3|nr:hypothetical protein CAOG_03940 [Capsaspora owczarzaki ATCC 30864]KJE93100.1 hypothetical protein CAOG_003940 [Capsaspora owczarzaki ATCC 30864]|eukprot:XP_004363668.1 hypothetical protein CAOG_03940 [Capsaspora owczarzaki ATCC 30864]
MSSGYNDNISMSNTKMDSWLLDHDNVTHAADEIMADINERNKVVRQGTNAATLNSGIRRKLGQLTTSIASLEQALDRAGRQYTITDKELSRRQGLTSALRSRRDQLNSMFNKNMEPGQAEASRDTLLYGAPGRAFGQGAAPVEREDTQGLDNATLLSRQQQIMQDQDRGLDALQAAIARQKHIGVAIGDEVDSQNQLLDDLEDGMDHTHGKLRQETLHVMTITEKAKTGGMLCIICLLIIAIIVVAAVPN